LENSFQELSFSSDILPVCQCRLQLSEWLVFLETLSESCYRFR
jgi:hypothetical protein